MAPTSIIFDFDYTLADSSPGVIECVNVALHAMGLGPAQDGAIRSTIGSSLSTTFTALTGDFSQIRAEEFTRRFVDHADTIMVDRTILLPHVAEVVAHLIGKELRLGIVSTKYRHRIEEVLRREHLDGHFDAIVGGEDVSEHKPDPKGLLRAIELLGQQRQDVLYVGDSAVDAETAERAGVAFVAVLSGVTPAEAFSNYRHLALLQNLAELTSFLDGIPTSVL